MTAPIEQPPPQQFDLFDAENPQTAALRADTYEAFMGASSCLRCSCCRIGVTNEGAPPIVAKGNPRGRVVIIGDYPVNLDRQNNEPFSGVAGRYVDQWLTFAHLPHRAIYMVNLVKCWPHDRIFDKKDPSQSLVKDRRPSAGEIETCFPLLLKQLSFTQPNYVIFFGSTAACACLGLKPSIKILDYCGHAIPIKVNGINRALGIVLPSPTYFASARDEVKLLKVQDTFKQIEFALRTSFDTRRAPMTYIPLPEEQFQVKKKPIHFERRTVTVR